MQSTQGNMIPTSGITSPISQGPEAQKATLVSNTHNVEKMNIKNLGTLDKVAHFVMARKETLSEGNLSAIQQHLEKRISDLNKQTETSSFRSFFNSISTYLKTK